MMGERTLLYRWLPIVVAAWCMDAHAVRFPPPGGGRAGAPAPIRASDFLSSPVKIRVRIAEAEPSVRVRGFDLTLREEAPSGKGIRAEKSSAWEIHCQEGRVRVSSKDEGQTSIDFSEPLLLQSQSGFLSLDNKPYRDEIRVYSNGSFCEVVNSVDIEKYLDGLVNAEFSSRWNEEAIAAQVVAARTYAYYQLLSAREEGPGHFDLDGSIWDQVYDGSMREDLRSSRIVQKSRGWLLTVTEGKVTRPIKAFYHSTCGGITELPQNVWGKNYPGFRRPVRCRFCGQSPLFLWRADLSEGDVVRAFLNGLKAEGLPSGWSPSAAQTLKKGRLLEIRPLKRNPQDRLLWLETVWWDGKSYVTLSLSASRFRGWLGINKVKSLAFEVRKSGSRWTLLGRGFGHGVGLCQWGAKAMGEKGYKMADILRTYYPDAVLRKMW